MYVKSYPSSFFDEQSRGNLDTASRSALYKVSLNQVSYGALNAADYKDYYELTPGIGSFKIVVTTDPSNGFSSNAYWYAFDIKITDSQGNILLSADPTHPDNFSDSITFSSAGYSTYYLEITNTLLGSFAYGAVLLDQGNRAPVVSVPMVDKNWIEGASLQFTVPAGTFTDPDGNALSYSATLSTGAALPAWLSFNSTTHTFSGTAPVSSPDYTVRVTATDTGGLSTFDDVVFFTPSAVNAATYVPYAPAGLIEKAMFNFDAFGIAGYKLTGTVGVSVSDAFTATQYHANPSSIASDIYTSLESGSTNWTSTQLNNINLVLSTYSNFINLGFSPVVNESGFTPLAVGSASNINISLIYRTDLGFSGESALNTDTSFKYAQSRGDIVLNVNGFGSSGLANDYTLDASTFGFHTLMHEIGHSIGLSHPHSSITKGTALLTADYAATINAGFDKLGFHINSSADMNKEYFSVMSYDDQTPAGAPDTFAQTPMILDVIALQTVYGEGVGSSGTGDNRITPGGSAGVNSYRTYFDTGGIDTIDLVNYSTGAYLHMGTSIVSAPHLVGVSMSSADANTMTSVGGDPASLRWFYGEYENASGSQAADLIVGNGLNNIINGLGGNDTIDGGAGTDTAVFQGPSRNYQLGFAKGSWTVRDKTGADGTDAWANMERLQFIDKTVITDSKVPGSYTDLPESLWQFCIVAFSAAPGVEYMNQMADAYRSGLSVQTIVDIFTSKSQFTDVYPTVLNHLDLASALVNNLVKDSASAAVKQGAIDDIVAALDVGWTVGKMIYTVFGNLASKPLDDPTWGNAAHQFQNQMAVAKYYTNIMDQSTTDLSTLRQVLAPVDQNTDVSTPEHIATLIGVALMT